MLPDILAASRPSFVHDLKLKKFELGKVEPKITNIKWVRSGWWLGRSVCVVLCCQ